MEYSIISMLGYFKDTLSNVGIPDSWLQWDLDDVTQIENKYVKHELNWIEKYESNPVKNYDSDQVGNNQLNPVVNGKSN